MYIVNDYLGTYGGSTTLILRMAEWAYNNSKKFKIYTNACSNTEIVTALHSLEVEIEVFDTSKISEVEKQLGSDLKKEECQIISFILTNFLNLETIKKKLKAQFINVLYAIHPQTFLKGKNCSIRIIKKIILDKYKSLICKLSYDNCLISMDYDIVEKTEKYYKCKFEKHIHVQFLPMICTELEEDAKNKKIQQSYESKTIVTACRAEFPYKGYIFGLLEDFEKLCVKYPNLKLEIACSGGKKDVSKVLNKINHLSDKCKSRIKIHKWMKYERLKELISNCYMCVGMGTSVLDAALVYVPSIAVKYDTYENVANSIFCEAPERLTGYSGKAINVIDRLLNLSYDDYKESSIKCFEAAKKNYNVEDFFTYIDNLPRTTSSLSISDVIIHLINNYVISKKKKDNYKFDEIEKES